MKLEFIILIIFMTFIASYGALQLKKASREKSFFKMIFNPFFIFGVFLYVIASLGNIFLLKYIPYGILLPTSSITYVWTLLLSTVILKENININKLIGITFIIAGCILINI